MELNHLNLDETTRGLMLEEIDADAKENKIYFSSYLSERGREDWTGLLKSAATSGTDEVFGHQLQQLGRLNKTAQRKKPKGGYSTVNVPITAHETLSEGEFNRFYIRALCRRALATKMLGLIIYRAKEVEVPRPESQQKIGNQVDPSLLLADLRANVGVETSSGFPGPNSGLSVKLP